MADTGLVTPIKYLSLVFAVTAGYFIFGEALKLTTIVGAGFIVVGTCLFLEEGALKNKWSPQDMKPKWWNKAKRHLLKKDKVMRGLLKLIRDI